MLSVFVLIITGSVPFYSIKDRRTKNSDGVVL